MTCDVRAIANEFIVRANKMGVGLANMKLQKLPYLAHAWSLAIFNISLVDVVPQTWKYGPVYPALYNALRRYGTSDVTEKIRKNGENLEAIAESIFLGNNSPRGDVFEAHLNEDEKKLIDAVWENYKNYSAFRLSALTHRKGTPWTQINERYGEQQPIPNDVIKSYYSEMIKKAEGAEKRAFKG